MTPAERSARIQHTLTLVHTDALIQILAHTLSHSKTHSLARNILALLHSCPFALISRRTHLTSYLQRQCETWQQGQTVGLANEQRATHAAYRHGRSSRPAQQWRCLLAQWTFRVQGPSRPAHCNQAHTTAKPEQIVAGSAGAGTHRGCCIRR